MSRTKTPLTIMALTSLTACTALPAGSNPPAGPLVIQEQGSFAVGGTVVNTSDTYSNNNPTAEGQSLQGDPSVQASCAEEFGLTRPARLLAKSCALIICRDMKGVANER